MCGIIHSRFTDLHRDLLRMPWHKFAFSSDPEKPKTERVDEFSLRVLMAVIIVTLIACVAFLTWRWISPVPVPSSLVPLTAVERPAATQPQPLEPAPTASAEVLLKPGQMYRCERNGRVTFSDHPCTEGSSRVMKLPAGK